MIDKSILLAAALVGSAPVLYGYEKQPNKSVNEKQTSEETEKDSRKHEESASDEDAEASK